MKKISIKGASGLGDAVYLYAVVKSLLCQGKTITVFNNFPEIFKSLYVEVKPYSKEKKDINCNYCKFKKRQETTQIQDMFELANISQKKASLSINRAKPVILITRFYNPMNNFIDRKELIPDYKIYQSFIDKHLDDCIFIQVGKSGGTNEYSFKNVHIDLTDKTKDLQYLLWLYDRCDGVLSMIGNAIAFAEAQDTLIYVLFSSIGLSSKNEFFNTITPAKVITKSTSYWGVDDDIDIDFKLEKYLEKIKKKLKKN